MQQSKCGPHSSTSFGRPHTRPRTCCHGSSAGCSRCCAGSTVCRPCGTRQGWSQTARSAATAGTGAGLGTTPCWAAHGDGRRRCYPQATAAAVAHQRLARAPTKRACARGGSETLRLCAAVPAATVPDAGAKAGNFQGWASFFSEDKAGRGFCLKLLSTAICSSKSTAAQLLPFDFVITLSSLSLFPSRASTLLVFVC